MIKSMQTKMFLVIPFLAMSFGTFAQVKIGDNPTTINAGSVLELESTNKGLLMPRISLTNTTTWGLQGTPAAGMHVYNTNTGITSSNMNYPTLTAKIGEYYWDGTGWVALAPVGAQSTPVQVQVKGVPQTVTGGQGVTVHPIPLNATPVFDIGNNKAGNTIIATTAGLYDVSAILGFQAFNTPTPSNCGLRLNVNNIEIGQFGAKTVTNSVSDDVGGRIVTRLNAGDVLTFTLATSSTGTWTTNNSNFTVIKVSN
jgi:hypothetical protein